MPAEAAARWLGQVAEPDRGVAGLAEVVGAALTEDEKVFAVQAAMLAGEDVGSDLFRRLLSVEQGAGRLSYRNPITGLDLLEFDRLLFFAGRRFLPDPEVLRSFTGWGGDLQAN